MKREEFKNWLINDYKQGIGVDVITAENRISNAQKVENAFGDLDEHFEKDHLQDFLEKLKYSKEDNNNSIPLPEGLSIDGDYYTGMATLRQGVRRYLDFRKSNTN